MEVKFTSTTKQNLNSLPIVNGQLIAVSDMDEYYYDLGSERRSVSGVVISSSLPASGQTNKLYIVSSNNEIQLYVYDGSQFHTTGSGNINDSSASSSTTYSSSKIADLLSYKQDSLGGSSYVGNIDSLVGQNKVYWINIDNLPSGGKGELPFDTGYFHLICLSESAVSSSQIAVPYYSAEGDAVGSGQLYYRQYTNSRWYSWRRVFDSTETSSAITSALEALDLSTTGGYGKYIASIEQTDGKVTATTGNTSSSINMGSTSLATAGAVFNNIYYKPGDSFQTSQVNEAVGVLTSSSLKIIFTMQLPKLFTSTYTEGKVTAMSVIIRRAAGGYIYLRSGSSGGTYTMMGDTAVSIWSNSASKRTGEISSITVVPSQGGRAATFTITLGYAPTSNSTGTAITNNSALMVDCRPTISFS